MRREGLPCKCSSLCRYGCGWARTSLYLVLGQQLVSVPGVAARGWCCTALGRGRGCALVLATVPGWVREQPGCGAGGTGCWEQREGQSGTAAWLFVTPGACLFLYIELKM